MAQVPLVGQGLLIIEALRSRSEKPRSVGLWTSDQPDAETPAWQHTKLRDYILITNFDALIIIYS